MASVTYGKCYLWQKYYVKCNYGKNIMANETEPIEPRLFVIIHDDFEEGKITKRLAIYKHFAVNN